MFKDQLLEMVSEVYDNAELSGYLFVFAQTEIDTFPTRIAEAGRIILDLENGLSKLKSWPRPNIVVNRNVPEVPRTMVAAVQIPTDLLDKQEIRPNDAEKRVAQLKSLDPEQKKCCYQLLRLIDIERSIRQNFTIL